jgi:hypothetical protein
MRKLLLIAAATLAVASCGPDNKPAQHNDSDLGRYAPRAVEAKLYHFKNGSVGYQDNGIWYYLILSQTNSTATTTGMTSGRSLGLTGSYANASFAKGNPPAEEEIDGAKVEEVEAVETEATETESPTESEATESSSGDSTSSDSSSGGDSGGGGDGGGGGGDGGGGGGGE